MLHKSQIRNRQKWPFCKYKLGFRLSFSTHSSWLIHSCVPCHQVLFNSNRIEARQNLEILRLKQFSKESNKSLKRCFAGSNVEAKFQRLPGELNKNHLPEFPEKFEPFFETLESFRASINQSMPHFHAWEKRSWIQFDF